MSQVASALKRKIKARKLQVGVIGLGYVGLPLACEFAHAGLHVIGIDTDRSRIEAIKKGKSFIPDIPSRLLSSLVRRQNLSASSSFELLSTCDVIVICVPTPLNKIQDPDISYIVTAVQQIKKNLRRGQLIILESTTYPGTTEEVILPELEERGLRVGRDLFLCFSPERIDPANPKFRAGNIPKVVGGVTSLCTQLGVAFYQLILDKVIPVSSTRTAEMTKLLENTFRIVNIGLINELATVAQALGIDIWEVIEAANTKPFGFMPFYPGPGVGGHCIGIDPVYLSWKARHHGKAVQFIELARLINTQMPNYIVERAVYLLNERVKKGVFGSKILAVGVAYKANVSDVRESPAVEIIDRLKELGAHVAYHDPHVLEVRMGNFQLRSQPLNAKFLRQQDLVLFLTDHSKLNRSLIAKEAKLIFDVRNAFKSMKKRSNIVKL
ncbi:MAG: UDP-N-acetyl-D-glucosamine dehydrogenase [Omnitrophica bacterium RIFCSPHIGHO2_02_FULL_46_11]|nr:MAG: UDP-N-acetyl-D-glucosamine dehydrogenase [Omnitrophica bacterium RIFCSPHIGHO2_02_FULL_46_11]OGW87202.1 MAG: UDP-N-acetyl-D-glucosamine dehydrogenase [Omnitrophica bacterium RIFCSPLOWO2_01_FULL_45_10b]